MLIAVFIVGSNRSSSVDMLFGLYKKAMADIGFDRLIFSLMTDHVHIQRQAGHGIMLNYPEDWMKYYVQKNFAALDPVRAGMYSADSIFVWDDLNNLTDGQKDFMDQGVEARLYDGVGIPLRGPQGAIAGVGAASSSGGLELNNAVLSYANLLSYQFYTVFLGLEKKTDSPPVFLSAREREILQWFAKGKTRWEIGEILEISEHTVAYHLKSIFQKLSANNITMAVLKALHMGAIQP